MVLTAALCALAAAAFASEAFQWVEFTNAMGVGVVYPDILTEGDEPYTDGDGVLVFERSAPGPLGDSSYFLELSARKDKKATAASRLAQWTDLTEDEFGYVYGVEPLEGTARVEGEAYTLDYVGRMTEDADVVHVYGIVRDGIVAEYRLGFPKAEAARFEAALKRMDESLKIAGE